MKKIITILAILLCTTVIVIAAKGIDEKATITTETASKLALQQLQECVNGDVYQTIEVIDSAQGAVVETEEGFEFGLSVTLKSKPIAESGWDTYYMQGMCEYFGINANEMEELSEAEIAERLKDTEYSVVAQKAAATLVYYADQRAHANTIASENYYSLLVKVNEATNTIEVFHDTDDLVDGRFKPIEEYLIPDTEAMKAQGKDTISELVTYWKDSL